MSSLGDSHSSIMQAEVLLPLPLPDTFTYLVPSELEKQIVRGCRVLVQFGQRKFYTGIVANLHPAEKKSFEVKPIISLLDNEPILCYPQLKFWSWMADYYLCSPGDVMKAALPSGLKVESETFISLNRDFVLDEEETLSHDESTILMVLDDKKRLRMAELVRQTGISRVSAAVERLLNIGAIEIDEKTIDYYRPQTKVMVELECGRHDHDKLHEIFKQVSRSIRQERLLIAYLDMSGWMHPSDPLREVEKTQLMDATGATPGIFRALIDKKIFSTSKKTVNRFNSENYKVESLAILSEAQKRAYHEIEISFKEHGVTLLHGITGSGKTEIYTHLINKVLESGRQILFLVPEISLTTQLTNRLRKVFGNKLLVYHSKFSNSERVDVWRHLLNSSEPQVVLGVRSSVFLPFKNLGLVIVDEEHEPSFKQYDPAPRYNARDSAIMLATMHGAKTLLGSATPSIETYYKAKSDKYGLVELNERFEGATLPEVNIIDMRAERKNRTNKGILSAPLKHATEKALEDGSQVIMFQNRRGFAPVVVCRECGWTPKCVNCDVSLVYHKRSGQLRCHYCGYSAPLPNVCPACGQNTIQTFGYGTERIADEVHQEFPDYRVSRMDLDTTRNKEAFQNIIEDFSRKETDILVGTQMVSKGLDFEKVKIVGVLNADTLLNFPDFRSGERAFNMLEQVSGRAGRRYEKGTVFIQTTSPDNSVLKFVQEHNYQKFYEKELAERHRYAYPPFTRVINIYIKHRDSATVDALAVAYSMALRKVFGGRVLGPEKPFVSRISTYYLQTIMLKIESAASMTKVKSLLRNIFLEMAPDPRMKQAILYYDVDPV